jgi:hypothetical protein
LGSLDAVEIVIGEFAPLLLNLTTELLPFTLKDIVVHGSLLNPSPSCGKQVYTWLPALFTSLSVVSLVRFGKCWRGLFVWADDACYKYLCQLTHQLEQW